MKKYQKVYREMYEQWYRENQAYREQVAADENRLAYHLMPETGWLNDPNGLCQVNGVYHIYYQYTPFEPTGELKLWGHCTHRILSTTGSANLRCIRTRTLTPTACTPAPHLWKTA